ncbi:uncharacterized protein LOC102800684 [Saccoglossus kowalevskii]|uniref:Uncharacterized protein LOC102800684 n=1 Tax=Saccoglossus kowalevskii TaxID=10224 RepID=A0ABM0LZE7_SACKO|nr:PREDICTED: uncharacterized protein LOC102800684 [Saccoglossus kowalevskii]
MDVRGLNLVNGVRLDKVWTTDRLPIAADSIPTKLDIKGWSHLNDIELPEIEVKDVTLLIGNDVPEAHWVLEERRGERKQPYGIRTLLGWTFIGPMGRKKRGGNSINFINVDQVLDSDSPIQCLEPITSQLHRMYNADFTESLFDTKACMSLEDRSAKAIMDSSVCLIEGHYQLALPWRYDDPCLPNNKWSALKRLKLLKRRLLKDPALMKKYKDTLDGYISQGHARRMPNVDSSATKSGSTWYLPHHPVIHSNKPEKVRVVFDCAAKYQGTSLNDQLLQGPDLNNTLVGVLLQFRKEPVAIVADIKQMFHQVKVKKTDCDALRFLWWPEGDLSKDPADHQMLVHPFGATSSPSCAAYALKRTADDNRSNYDTHIVDTVYRNFYVDDCLKSVASVEEAKELVKLLPEMLAKGGFHLTKWISNCREILALIPEAERASSVMNLDMENLPIDRALGIQWDVEKDAFNFRIGDRLKEETRREMLSFVASVYDPLGFAAPFVLPAKRILQELCRVGYGWDEKVPEDQLSNWREWRKKNYLL